MPDFRVIPSVEQLRQRPGLAQLEQLHGAVATVAAIRGAADDLRRDIASGSEWPNTAEAAGEIERRVRRHLTATARGSLRGVINATGVVIHTNLGRAPLARAAIARVEAVCHGYSNLEYDLVRGGRGSRAVHAEALLTTLTGAEAAVVVNNNAAATMLILAALGHGREVVISRGELVEIGGGFRVPDVMAHSGAILREVGTTNRTRIADYRAAVGPRTAMFLRVHPSNFRIEGFTERPPLEQLVDAARDSNIPLIEDLGSGSLLDTIAFEPAVQASIRAGVDVICFSGDKMLGGPQAGIIVGRKSLVQKLQTHPLMRALRVDKLTLAALEGTLLEYHAGRARQTVPIVEMLSTSAKEIERRARGLSERLRSAGWQAALVNGASAVGGGSAPGVELPTVLIAVAREGLTAAAILEQLRVQDPPVVARIADDRVVLDLRTVFDSQEDLLVRSLTHIT